MKRSFAYQKEGCDFLSQKKFALLADEQGLGKTVQAILALNVLRAKRVLVTCPASLKLNWKREIEKWADINHKIFIVRTKKDKLPEDAGVIIINYDLLVSEVLRKQLRKRNFQVGIYDEAHYLKNQKAKRTKFTIGRYGIVHECTYNWFLTGTPMPNRPIDLYPLLKVGADKLIHPYNDFWTFSRRFCAGWQAPWGFDSSGASNLEDLHRRIAPIYLRREKREVLDQLPDKTYQLLELDLPSGAIKKIRAAEASIDPQTLKKIALGEEITAAATLRRETAEAKTPICIEYIKEWLENNPEKKLVIFAHHKLVVAALLDGLVAYLPLSIVGSTPMNDRQAAVDTFQTVPNRRLIVGNIQAMGLGHTLTAASNVIFVETSYVPGEIEQAVDRCHRIGQKNAVLAQFLVACDTIEERILKIALDKLENIRKVVK